MICNLNNINDIISCEKLELLVVSYGGSCSNTLVDLLQKNKFICRTKTWGLILCHCPHYIECNIPIIYIYDNPIKALISMKNRGLVAINQAKMSNDENVTSSDENLLRVMIQQFNSWTSVKRNNVLIIKSSEIFEDKIVNKLETFLKKKINHFPVKYIPPKTNIDDISDIELTKLFEKYKLEIDTINNFV